MQKYINKISRKYKDKKIIVYGAGSFSKSIFEKYDLSELNIIAVADLKFETALEKEFYGYKGVSPEDISNLKADIILIANEDYNYFSMVVENILAKNCIKKVHIIPLIKQKQRRIKISDIFFESLYVLFNPKDFASLILRIMAKLASFYIVDRYERRIRYEHLYNIFGTRLYGAQVLKTAKSIGKKFWCGGFSSVTKNTVLKDRVCFNGMKIIGNGKVTIGNYFHSGTDVLIITQNHNYDKGIAIPYDITYIFKDIEKKAKEG